MADMMKEFVTSTVEELFKTEYTHLQYPACVRALVAAVVNTDNKNYCSLRILTQNKEIDERFPIIPFVQTTVTDLQKEDMLVVVFLYGACEPYILGRIDE